MKQPNLLFLMSDNHNRDASGCYGHPTVKTPTIDRLAKGGVRFENAYSASPICCPARAALATGKFPHQTGYWDNILAYDGRVKSWMHQLRSAGYEVVSVGKLHFRSTTDDNGFSTELVPMHIMDGRGDIRALLRGYDAAEPNTKSSLENLYFKQAGVGISNYQKYDEDITQHAISWLREKTSVPDKPWALFVSYVSPHPPFIVPERFYNLYAAGDVALPDRFSPTERSLHPAAQYHREISATGEINEQDVRHLAAAYYALISFVDDQMAQVLKEAESLDLLQSANVIYTSDHGEMYGAHGLLGKNNLYESSVAVPLIIAGPTIQKGGVASQPVSHVDLYPTILEACGLPSDANANDYIGKSLWPALNGEESSRPCFAEYHAKYSKNGSFMIRDGMKKLIYHVDMPPQLFDLESDPGEAENLAPLPEFRDELLALETKLRGICDPEDVDRRAKQAQRDVGDRYGGVEALTHAPNVKFTPPPGAPLDAL